MTEKEKVSELFEKFYSCPDLHKFEAKQCALICVEEILSEYSVLQIETSFCFERWKYWSEVEKQIELL